MSSEYEADLELKAELDRMLTFPATSGTWSNVEERARKKGWRLEEQWSPTAGVDEDLGDQKQKPPVKAFVTKPSARRAFTPRRTSGLRVAVFASVAIVLVAAITVGSLEAARHLGNDQPILVIGDDTLSPATTGQTTQTAASAQSGQWERLPLTTAGLITEGGVVDQLVMDPSDPSILYVSGHDGMFKSTDGARSWSRLTTPFAWYVWLIALDPASPSTIYVLAYPSAGQTDPDIHPDIHLYRSDDGGATWTELSAAPPIYFYTWPSILFDTTSIPSAVSYTSSPYESWYGSFYARSTDRGETWTRNEQAPAAAVDAGYDQLIWDQGDWKPSPTLPASAQQALAALKASFPDPVTITDAYTGAPVAANPGSLHVDPSDLSIFYVGTDDGVYKSTDGGTTWKKASAGLTCSIVNWVVPDPSSASSLYAGTPAGIFKTVDGGDTWNMIVPGLGDLIIAPSSPSRLYAWTTAGLFRSDDSGENWSRRAAAGLGSLGEVEAGLVLTAVDNPDIVFALGGSGDGSRALFRSTDGGDTWNQVLGETPPANGFDLTLTVVADPNNPSTLFAARDYASGQSPDSLVHARHVLKSTDGGATWTVVSPQQWVNDDAQVISLAIAPGSPATIWVTTWGPSPIWQRASAIWRSTDGGDTWTKPAGPEGLGTAWQVDEVLVDPRSSDTVYVPTHPMVKADPGPDPGLYRSTDGGATWENIIGELSHESPWFLTGPAPGGGLYAVTPQGLYKWVPAGE